MPTRPFTDLSTIINRRKRGWFQIILQGRERVEKRRDEIRKLEASEEMKALFNK